MLNKLMSFIFSTEEDELEEEIVVEEPMIQHQVVNEPAKGNANRKEVYIEEPQPQKQVFIDLEETKEEPQVQEDYRSYRQQVERKERVVVEDTRGQEFIAQPIISPIFGTSEKKEISKKDEELNNFDEVIKKPSTGNIISPMFGVSKPEPTTPKRAERHAQEAEIPFVAKVEPQVAKQSKYDDIALEDMLVDDDKMSKTQQFKLFELQEEEPQAKVEIMSLIDEQLKALKEEPGSTTEDFIFENSEHLEDTKVFRNLKQEIDKVLEMED
ncbi:MAG: hypothetical protein ACRCZJ_01160 [Erysipelotrichaceae bacterium]